MKLLKKFEEFLAIKIIRKQRPDQQRALSLAKEAESKKEFLEKIISNFKIDETNSNSIIELCYDIIIELLRAKLFSEGFNSNNSHEAEVSFMRNLGFEEKDVIFMDEIRFSRNRIKYYGKLFGEEYTRLTLSFLYKNYPKLRGLIK